jgi:hypothetical protein
MRKIAIYLAALCWISTSMNVVVFAGTPNPKGDKPLEYKDWVEATPQKYAGCYRAEISIDDVKGGSGSGGKVFSELELQWENGNWRACYRVKPVAGKEDWTESQAHHFKIDSNKFSADPIIIKCPWPYYLPKRVEGRFVLPEGLVMEGFYYHREVNAAVHTVHRIDGKDIEKDTSMDRNKNNP